MIIHPHEGVGPLRFGMDRTSVERALGLTPNRFTSSEYALPADSFPTLGTNVMYDEHGLCNAISAVPALAAQSGTAWTYEGYRLFAHPALEVRAWALSRDPGLERVEGFTSKALGLGMWVDWIDAPDLSPEDLLEPAGSFIVFRPRYHEDELARLVAAGLLPAREE